MAVREPLEAQLGEARYPALRPAPRTTRPRRAAGRHAIPLRAHTVAAGVYAPPPDEPSPEVQQLLARAVELSAEEGQEEAAEDAFREAAEADGDDARAPLNLGRYLAKLGRPGEAIEQVPPGSAVSNPPAPPACAPSSPWEGVSGARSARCRALCAGRAVGSSTRRRASTPSTTAR